MIHMPTFAEVLEVSRSQGRISENPGAWAGLVGAWTGFQGGGKTLFDVSGYGNHGTLTNMDPATDWVIGGNPRLPGYAVNNPVVDNFGHILFPESDILQPVNRFSWCLWLKRLGNASGNDHIVRFGELGEPFFIQRSADDYMWGRVKTSGSGNVDAIDTIAIPLGVWTFYVLTYDGTDVTLWRNGNAVATNSATGTITYDAQGLTLLGDGVDEPFLGQTNFFSIYSRALAPAEIQQLYDKPAAMFTRRRRIYAAVVAAPSQSIVPIVTAAYYRVNA